MSKASEFKRGLTILGLEAENKELKAQLAQKNAEIERLHGIISRLSEWTIEGYEDEYARGSDEDDGGDEE